MNRIIQVMFFITSAAFAAAQESQVSSAWAVLSRPGPILTTNQDALALDVLRKNKAETRRLVVRALTERKGPNNAESLANLVFERSEMLEIARTVLPSYPIGDLGTPFLGFLASKGDLEDMDFLKQWIARDPNSEGIVGLTRIMSENPSARAALVEMKGKAPGRWTESSELKSILGASSPGTSEAQPHPISIAPSPPPASGGIRPAGGQSSPATESPGVQPQHRATWIIAGAGILVLLVFLIRRRR